MMVTWDETIPTSALAKSLIDDELRRMKLAIRERMGQEHQFGPFTDFDTGRHIPGKTTVLGQGDSTDLAAITTMQAGSLFLLEDGSDLQVQLYNGSAWVALSTLDHAVLTGRDDDDHPGLLKKDGGIMAGDLDMGTYKITTSGSGSTHGIFTLYGHRALSHATIGDIRAITDASLTANAFNIVQETTTTSVSDTLNVVFTLPAFYFLPQVYAQCAYNAAINIIPITPTVQNPSVQYGFSVRNLSGSPVVIRVRREYLI